MHSGGSKRRFIKTIRRVTPDRPLLRTTDRSRRTWSIWVSCASFPLKTTRCYSYVLNLCARSTPSARFGGASATPQVQRCEPARTASQTILCRYRISVKSYGQSLSNCQCNFCLTLFCFFKSYVPILAKDLWLVKIHII